MNSVVANLLPLVSTLLLVFSGGYLVIRTAKQWLTQGRSYKALPYGDVAEFASDLPHVDRCRGAMLGVALGDALGMPREMLPIWLANVRFGRSPALSRGVVRFMRRRGTVSDDTQVTVATAQAIDDEGVYRRERFRESLIQWIPCAIGPGRATLEAARGYAAGRDGRDEGSQGNGAAMRVVPLAIAYRHDLEAFLEAVHADASQTHPNPEAIAAAEVMGRLVILLFDYEGEELPNPEDLVDTILPRRYSEDVAQWEMLLNKAAHHSEKAHSLQEIGTSGWVKHTLPAVVHLLMTCGPDYDRGLRRLFDAGKDIDTIAALYLSALGAWKGTAVFPSQWLNQLQGAPTVLAEADRLAQLGEVPGA